MQKLFPFLLSIFHSLNMTVLRYFFNSMQLYTQNIFLAYLHMLMYTLIRKKGNKRAANSSGRTEQSRTGTAPWQMNIQPQRPTCRQRRHGNGKGERQERGTNGRNEQRRDDPRIGRDEHDQKNSFDPERIGHVSGSNQKSRSPPWAVKQRLFKNAEGRGFPPFFLLGNYNTKEKNSQAKFSRPTGANPAHK